MPRKMAVHGKHRVRSLCGLWGGGGVLEWVPCSASAFLSVLGYGWVFAVPRTRVEEWFVKRYFSPALVFNVCVNKKFVEKFNFKKKNGYAVGLEIFKLMPF